MTNEPNAALSPATSTMVETVDRQALVMEDTTPSTAARDDRTTTYFLFTLGVLSTISWYFLYRWYGLFENRDNTHFAFEKIPGWFDSSILRQTALLFVLIAVLYAAVIWLLHSMDSIGIGAGLAIALIVAGPAIANIALYPVGALDVFNYMIELKLTFFYDQNPYLVTFEAFREDAFALPAFLVDITLFYGPAWLLVSWIPTAIVGFDDVIKTLLALKIFNLALLGAIAGMIALYQRDRRRGWIAAVVFLANPLLLFEGVANVHNDVVMTAFLVGAMLALQRRSPLAGPLLALSALVKLYTVVLIPIFVVAALRARWGWRRTAAACGLTVVTVVLVCAPYWGDGKLVDGLRSGLKQSQEMDHVSLYSLGQQYAQEREADGAFDAEFILSRPSAEILPEGTRNALRNGFGAAFIAGALLLVFSVWKGRAPEIAGAETLLLLLLLLTNLYAWYLIPVFALFALRLDRLSRLYLIVATLLGLAYYPMYVYAHFNTEWTRFEVHQFLALFLTAPIVIYLAARLVAGGMNSRRQAIQEASS